MRWYNRDTAILIVGAGVLAVLALGLLVLVWIANGGGFHA